MAREFICSSTEPVVETKAGKIRGFKIDSTYTFWGIKYANAKRWEMPTEVEPWEGVEDALSYGYVSPMLQKEGTAGEIMCPHRYWVKDENCQYLNVWTQHTDRTAKRPVLVWFHGGGFAAGSSIEQVSYDGENISKKGDVVFVSCNHRLNIIGYLDLSSFSDKFWNSGNVGNADLVACLKWVHDNIEAFGGDPNNVTIMGQSGGGRKVQSMMQIPDADGLFHKAFIMSGISDFRRMFGNPETAKEDARTFGIALYNELGIDYEKDPLALQDVPYEKLAEAYNRIAPEFKAKGMYTGSAPMKNDWYAGDPVYYGFREHAKEIPTVAGTCLGEFSFGDFVTDKNSLSEAEKLDALKQVYGDEIGVKMAELFAEAYPGKCLTDAAMLDNNYRRDTKTFVKKKAEMAPNVWNYLFTYEFPYNGGKIPWHCSDIAFWFNNLDKVIIGNKPGVSDRLVDRMSRIVLALAETGSPQIPDIPAWKPSTADTVHTMIVDDEFELRTNHDDELYEVFWNHRPDLKKYNPKGIALR
ncbi:MAG: carboxylesterase/lipase family protein [Solobacterium sp.]|nr:carboxylesterase/lipase family protein [Solobacterium sp.]